MTNTFIGKMLGAYKIINQLGQGGMATVYLGYQEKIDRYVAIKILPPHPAQDVNAISRFETEARTIARLQHPHILPLYDFGEQEGIFYLVMAYADGGSLARRVENTRLSLKRIEKGLFELADAVDYAHAQGVYHRDIKAANILLTQSDYLYLADFGIAKLAGSKVNITGSGVVGTPTHMAPEQAKGSVVDSRADVYSLGVVVYEMLTGTVPFQANGVMQIMLKVIQNAPPSILARRPDLPPALADVINKVLAKAPDERYQTATEFAEAFSAVVSSLDESQKNTPPHTIDAPTSNETIAPLDMQIEGEPTTDIRPYKEMPTHDLIRHYSESKRNNVKRARELLTLLSNRDDVPIFFDLQEEDAEIKVIELRVAEQERKQKRAERIHNEYEELSHYVTTLTPRRAIKAIRRFVTAYPEYGDPKDLQERFKPTVETVLAKPFAWVNLPSAQYIKGYSISKYPITNAQYAEFIRADGYNEPKWWTSQGWIQREMHGWIEPQYWYDSKWNQPDHPVVGVSWYEAVAFCYWLSALTQEKIMIPTEGQWQFAAEGDSKDTFPWGNDWDCKLCNNSVGDCVSAGTTSVTHYQGKGDSPFGAVDMSGNVWEWCVNEYATHEADLHKEVEYRALRGGSWGADYQGWFRCRERFWFAPHGRGKLYGFRIVRNGDKHDHPGK